MIKISLIGILATLSVAAITRAQADIYKCTDDDGNVAYMQLPCPVKPTKPVETMAEDESTGPEDRADSEYAEPEYAEPAPAPSSRLPDESLEECKKRYRDQIDAVEAEMFTTDVATQGETFKEKLLALAQQLRACE